MASHPFSVSRTPGKDKVMHSFEKESLGACAYSPGADRRQAQRVAQATAISWLPVSGHTKDFAPAILRNISPSGFSICVDRLVEVGTVVTIRLPNRGNAKSWMPWAEVIYSLKQDPNLWIIGCKVIGAVPEAWRAQSSPRLYSAVIEVPAGRRAAAKRPRKPAAGARKPAPKVRRRKTG
jgi:hypothetical protein